ncbi:hypothetical protein J6590_071889 [Homalodisca vitripennis]|nr:hypothetical protein J6590_071889 [Homalodisca vitripennis]
MLMVKSKRTEPDIQAVATEVQVASECGVGPSLSCFCCSSNRSNGDGPGPNHSDWNKRECYKLASKTEPNIQAVATEVQMASECGVSPLLS